MLDAAQVSLMQRSAGEARVGFSFSGGRARLATLRQCGSAKAILPRTGGDVPEVVFLNTSGGLTGGDRLDYGLTLAAAVRAVATTQAAERAYHAGGGSARATVRASVGPGGHLAWLPQETILYEDCDLVRDTRIDLAGDASCLLAETVILGRRAMGEHPLRARLSDRRMVRRDGRAFWAESLRIDPDFLHDSARAARLGPAGALAVVALIAPGAADAVGPLRAVLDEPGCRAEASGWDGRCLLRILAADGWPLRRQLVRALGVLHPGALPRVWQFHGASR